jgi:endonuclease-8
VPEGDTIYKTAAALRPILVGQTVIAARARTPGPAIERVVGSQVAAVEPLGKHLLIRFSNGLTLHTHLRMAGAWHRYAPGERWKLPDWKARVVLEIPGHVLVCFNAPVAELMPDRAVELHPAIQSLGPDLLDDAFDAADAHHRLSARPTTPIADALLDQRALAGIGNVFKSEILFLEHVNPWTPVAALDPDALRRVVDRAAALLRHNATVPGGGRVTTAGDRHAGGNRLWVYGRARRACLRCGTPVRMARQGELNRLTYWCPRCQPADVP